MKKIFALVLVLAMVMSLSACFFQVKMSDGDKQSIKGSVVDNVYENEFLGIGCELDSNWTYKTDEEMKAQYDVAYEYTDEEFQEYLETAQLVYDMYASHSNATDSINVNIEKVSAANNLIFSAKQYLESSEATTVEAFKNMGYTDVKTNLSTVEIDGKTFDALYYECSYLTITVYVCSICFEVDDYVACITVSALSEEDMNSYIDTFYLI